MEIEWMYGFFIGCRADQKFKGKHVRVMGKSGGGEKRSGTNY